MTDLACQQTITALAAGRILDAPPLVTCTVDELAQALPGLDVAEDNIGAIGRDGSQISWRAVRQGIAAQMLRVWHDGDRVLAIEVERPDTPEAWPELRDKLGTPSQKFDVVRPVVRSERLCFYTARGFATQTSATGERLDRVMAFPPTTAGDFITHLAMSLVPPRERVGDEVH